LVPQANGLIERVEDLCVTNVSGASTFGRGLLGQRPCMPERCRRESLISCHGSANANGLTHDVELLVDARNGRGVSRNVFDLPRHDVAPATRPNQAPKGGWPC
jgi:hypothetical protein